MNNYSLESFISFCDDMQIAEEGFKISLKNANKVKEICKRISVKKKGSLLRTSVDMNTVKQFIDAVNKEFDKVVYSKVIHVTGDANYYTQRFVALSGKKICRFDLRYDDTQIHFFRLSDYREMDISDSSFSSDFIMNLYGQVLQLDHEAGNAFGSLSIKKNKIVVNSYERKLDEIYSKMKNDKYDFSLTRNGYKLVITDKKEE